MPSEMLSGPDLGAGFLYQLSHERIEGRSGFTFHAQPGGADANGPPIGTPEPLGWVRATGMCMFGGRECYHRVFDLPAALASHVRAAYNRTRFVMAASLDQCYRDAAVPLHEGFGEWLDRVSGELGRHHQAWFVGGDLALALHGIERGVRSVVVHTTPDGVAVAADAIPEYLIEPAGPTTWGDRAVIGARAFVGTLQAGVRIGWASSHGPDPRSNGTPWSMSEHDPAPPPVEWAGRRVPVAPLPLLLGGAAVDHDAALARELAGRIEQSAPDRRLLRSVLRGAAFDRPPFRDLKARLLEIGPPLEG